MTYSFDGQADDRDTPVSLSRRRFLKTGAIGGAGAVALGLDTALAAEPAAAGGIEWDHEVDFLVVGAGPGGMLGAIMARDAGATVMVVEQNFDIGGRAILSGGGAYLGGGTSLQADQGIEDSPEAIVADWTRRDHPLGRYNDRELVWAYARACVDTFNAITENGVVWEPLGAPDRIDTIPRRAFSREWPVAQEVVVAGQKGSGLMRPLEYSARRKGVEILLQHRMTTIHRESPTTGRVLGITAIEVDKWFQPTYRTVNIRARKGVLITTGGHSNNVNFRRIFDPRLTEEYQVHGDGWSPKLALGELASMAIGASLWGTANQTNEADGQLSKGRIAVRSNYHGLSFTPESPNFFRERATGLLVSDYQNVILVKETGKRFYNEMASSRDYNYFAAALDWTGDPQKLNGGGPIWAIFDADAVQREGWQVAPPYVDLSGYFFSADTLEELAANIVNPYQWRPMPGATLIETVERYNASVDSGKDDDFKKPTPMHKIQKPPFYAAWSTPCVHDTYVGLRINTNAQVMDLAGEPIPGLYAAGDSAGGFGQHGLGRSFVFGRLGALHAVSSS